MPLWNLLQDATGAADDQIVLGICPLAKPWRWDRSCRTSHGNDEAVANEFLRQSCAQLANAGDVTSFHQVTAHAYTTNQPGKGPTYQPVSRVP